MLFIIGERDAKVLTTRMRCWVKIIRVFKNAFAKDLKDLTEDSLETRIGTLLRSLAKNR